MRILSICGALAAGEFVASFAPQCSSTWPLLALVTAAVVLFGYGLMWRTWPFVATFFAGMALFMFAATDAELRYRDRPWMRGRKFEMREERNSSSGGVAAVRCDLLRRVSIGLDRDAEAVALNRAILLGERSRLPRRMKRVFVESGTMHVFAISGLHVMAVAKVLTMLLAMLFIPRRVVGALAIPLLWGYVCLIGWSPSAVRAAMMTSFCFLAPLFWRRPDGVRAWALTFCIVHVSNPRMITDVGCALSFVVMLAIILAGTFTRSLGGWRLTVLMTFVAWAAGVPISAHVFGRVTPGALLANLVLIGVVGLTVVFGVAGVLASFVSWTLAAHLNNLSALCTHAMIGVSEAVSRLEWSNFEVGQWTLLQCAEWYALFALVVVLIRLRRARSL